MTRSERFKLPPAPATRSRRTATAFPARLRQVMPAAMAWVGYCIVLFPWLWLSIDGLKPRLVMLMTGGVGWLAVMLLGLLPQLFNNIGFVLLSILYALVLQGNERFNTTACTWRDIVLITINGVATGVLLGAAKKSRMERPATYALLTIAVCCVVAGLLVQQFAGAGSLGFVERGGGEMFRVNDDSVEKAFGVFGDTNVIIGVIPMTISMLCYLPFMLLSPWSKRTWLMAVPFLLACYCNLNVATRTALAACAGTTVIMALMLMARDPSRRHLIRSTLVSVALIAGAISFALPHLERLLQPIQQRFAQIQDDSRLEIWAESWVLIWRNPTGGGSAQLSSHTWAHNAFLDAGLICGLAGVVLLIGMHLVWAHNILKAWRQGILSKESQVGTLVAFSLGGAMCSMVLAPLWITPYTLAVATSACATALELAKKSQSPSIRNRPAGSAIRTLGSPTRIPART